MSATTAPSAADQGIGVDEGAVAVLAGAHRDAPAGDGPVCVDGPGPGAAQRGDGPALVARGFEGNVRRGHGQLVDAHEVPQLGPGDLAVARNEGKQEAAVLVFHHERLHDVGRRDPEDLRSLLKAVGGEPLHDFDVQAAGRGVGQEALPSGAGGSRAIGPRR